MHAIKILSDMVEKVPQRLRSLAGDSGRRSGPDGWSRREELGHLLDSAVMNHVRLMRVETEDAPQLPGYDGPLWVRAHNYQDRAWDQLIETWQLLNEHFLMAAEGTPTPAWQRRCTLEGSQVTLEFLFTDYVQHALHHLEQIGVRVDDFEIEIPQARTA